eukprot:TRINITY_DN4587_c0_g1_i1.p1 TRINITY_DN4587_c0_g1~~TRINITY_DN4587_c0_g1_i1.p1  ORF type:complete len:318 (+),score=52.62 TRINITY_DN4587_c0_g1_i1:30-983(+)
MQRLFCKLGLAFSPALAACTMTMVMHSTNSVAQTQTLASLTEEANVNQKVAVSGMDIFYDRLQQIKLPSAAAAAATTTTTTTTSTATATAAAGSGGDGEHNSITFRLVGTGKRTLWGLLNLYALGLYVHPQSVDLSVLKQVTAETTTGQSTAPSSFFTAVRPKKEDTIFESTILGDYFDKAIHLKFARAPSGSHVATGFTRRLTPRLQSEPSFETKYKPMIDQFANAFALSNLQKETQVLFVWRRGGNLHVLFNNTQKLHINDPVFSSAVFDIYLGHQSALDDRAQLVTAWKAWCQQLLTHPFMRFPARLSRSIPSQ